VRADWERTADGLRVAATVPPTATGRLSVPAAAGAGVTVEGPASVDGDHENGRWTATVPAGTWTVRVGR
jgi:hypothetical protein